MNWAERHLNWALVLGVVGAGFAIYILGGVIGFIIGLVLVAYVAGWHVQRKGRNLWNVLWIFAPFGIVLLLCLKNLTRKETESKVSAEKERHEISTTESQDKEREYEHNVREIYRREWATASSEKKVELNKRMFRWLELMKDGLTASQAHIRVMQEEPDKSPIYTAIEEESDYRVVEEPSDKHPAIPSAPRMRKAPLIFLSLALVAAIIYCIVITGDRDALNTELQSVQSVLASTQTELSSTRGTLASTQGELSSTKQTLTSTKTELSSTKLTLVSTQSELSSTKQTLTSTQGELNSTKQTLSSTQQQLAVAQETLGGLGITLSTVKLSTFLSDNSGATNPTWSQLMTFLSEDQTEKRTYIVNVYDCTEFSRDVHNNAEAAGIKAAFVGVDFRDGGSGHALNAFLTTDYGLVYVDCTPTGLDKIARIKAGKEYRAVEVYGVTRTNFRNDYWWDALDSYYYIRSSTGGQAVTSSIEIYW